MVATVGGAVVAGVTPVPLGARNLALDPGPHEKFTPGVAGAPSVKRQLLGSASRDDARAPLAPADAPSKLADSKAKTAKRSPKPTVTHQNPWTCAVAGCAGSMDSGFGARLSPGGIGSTYHLGDDFAIPWGTPLRAMHLGTVVSTGWVSGFGIHVTIDYGDGIQITYGHLSSVTVAPGQSVARGQQVGYSGNTGVSTGPHLHLEIHLNGTPIDPTPWLQARGVF